MFKKSALLLILVIITYLSSAHINAYILTHPSKATNDTDTTVEAPTITATAAVVYDVESGLVLYNKNMDRHMYPASITKLMTALLCINTLSPEETITFSENAIDSVGTSSSIGIRPGEILTVEQTLYGMLLMSSNPCANAIAETTSGNINDFTERMNQEAQELGAFNTHFTNPHGLFDANHYTTSYDMALITNAVIQSDYLIHIMQESMYQIPPTNKCDETRYLAQQHKMLNTKKDMSIYRKDVFAGKVGYTNESGHTLVTAADNGSRKIIVVVMNTDYQNVYKDTAKLIDYGYISPLPKNEGINLPDLNTATLFNPEDTSLTDTGGKKEPTKESSSTLLETSNSSELKEENKTSSTITFIIILIIVLFISLAVLYLYFKEKKRKERLMLLKQKYKNARNHNLK